MVLAGPVGDDHLYSGLVVATVFAGRCLELREVRGWWMTVPVLFWRVRDMNGTVKLWDLADQRPAFTER